jgi:predicted transcriptional regulator
MDSSAARRLALMSIHPRYAEAILAGRKQAEFRKRPLAADVDVVLMYATAPVSAIVGWFTVSGTVKSAPDDIWRCLHNVGEIGWPDFADYYAGRDEGVAFLIGKVGRLPKPVSLSEIKPGLSTPQSFNYVSRDVLAQILSDPDLLEEAVLAVV